MIAFLAKFPSTNAVVCTGCLLALSTGVAVYLGWKPPDGWFLFVTSFAGVAAAQFTGKRMTQHKAKNAADA